MTVAAEKAEIMKRVSELHDPSVIHAIKELLDDVQTPQDQNEAFEASIKRGREQSRRNEVFPHEEVMQEFRRKYKA